MKHKPWMIGFSLLAAANLCAQAKTSVVEEIVARVNNEIITREDLAHARENLDPESRDECPTCTAEQVRTAVATKEKNLLRDLIDQSLLVQRAKDAGVNVDVEVIKRLDEIRQRNKLPDLDALEREVSKSGQDYEDFKTQIKNQLLTQEIIRKEAGGHVIISHEEVAKYYEEHKSDFVRPETAVLREIFVSAEGKTAAELPALKKKAEGYRDRVLKNGDDFGELAKRFSDAPTAQQNGELGAYARNQLDPQIAAKVFSLNRGQMTDVLETKAGYEILQVRERYEAGQQPLEKVDPEISSRLYEQKMEPALRAYLTMLREDSYIQIKPGYVDTAAVNNEPIEEVAAAPEKDDTKKKSGRRLLILPKKKSGS
jgi:peptidyl-prolyl cis-trans isomerase SurA